MATVLYDKVLLSHKMNDCRTERIVNSSSYQPSERVLMSQADIFDFMRFIFDCGQVLSLLLTHNSLFSHFFFVLHYLLGDSKQANPLFFFLNNRTWVQRTRSLP